MAAEADREGEDVLRRLISTDPDSYVRAKAQQRLGE
jgi:HEAT repeat protein